MDRGAELQIMFGIGGARDLTERVVGHLARPARPDDPEVPRRPGRHGSHAVAEADHGIWETRGEPRHFVYSKLMCWVALDRAIALADRVDALDRVERWKATREEISDAIMTLGWNEDVGAFTQSFGSGELDASNLMMPVVGSIPAESPRMRATIDATAAHLTDQRGLIYRISRE
jgi:alpha,alpha-trehalase